MLFGRRAHPASLCLTMSSAFIAITYLGPGQSVIEGPVAIVVGLVAAAGAAIKTAAWAADSWRLLRMGLFASVFVWSFVVIAGLSAGLYVSSLLATSILVLAGGTFYLESSDPPGGDEGG